jgi:asparagine synthase (glutamine-hydrolysing)
MSGIFGIVRWDQKGVHPSDLESMYMAMQHRGRPISTVDLQVGLGHLANQSSPKETLVTRPWEDPDSGQLICADARIDNREELQVRLGLGRGKQGDVHDHHLIMAAYQKRGNHCARHLVGDFAFAVWDRRRKRLYCARDHMGMRPFYYFQCREFFAFASSPQAVLRVDGVSHEVNHARVADYLIQDFEGIDTQSTFFTDISRLSPAHTLEVTPSQCSMLEYWRPDPAFELVLASDDDYLAAFTEVFSKAVDDRLRASGPVASMLSGGIDSSVIAAIAGEQISRSTGERLSTFSAVSGQDKSCLETQFVKKMTGSGQFNAHQIEPSDLEYIEPEFQRLLDAAEDPFDADCTIPALMYLLVGKSGHHALLDGVDGDLAVSLGPAYPIRLLRMGRYGKAWSETRNACRNYWPDKNAISLFSRYSLSAAQPAALRKLRLHSSRESRIRRRLQNSLVSPDLCEKAGLLERYSAFDRRTNTGNLRSFRESHINRIKAPYLVAAVERYGRLASYCQIENRAPLLDRRLLEFCISLPWNQKVRDGWSKYILRKLAETVVPQEVAWRRDHTHVGWNFTRAWLRVRGPEITDTLTEGEDLLGPYVAPARLARHIRDYEADKPGAARDARILVNLVNWLEKNMTGHRPHP